MVGLIGIPYDQNSSFLKGPAYAPDRIRLMESEGSANAFSESGQEIAQNINYKDLGNITFENGDPKSAFEHIYKSIKTKLIEHDKILAIGGDHSISYPLIKAHAEKYNNLNVLHLDAHADLYEDFENNKYSHASPFARILEEGNINRLIQVGIRTLNTHQRQQIQKYGVELIEMSNFSLDFINTLKGPIYVSLDLDVLDPAYAPGVSHHEPGGTSTRQLISLIQSINVSIIGADVVEYNPIRDVNNMTAMVAYKLIKEIIAKML